MGAAGVAMTGERGRRAADRQCVRRPGVDAHRARVARLQARPQVAPGGATVLGAEEPGRALGHRLRVVLEATEARGRVEDAQGALDDAPARPGVLYATTGLGRFKDTRSR